MTLKIAKGRDPLRAEKKRAITHPNQTNGIGCRPSPEKKTKKSTIYTLALWRLHASSALTVEGKGRYLK
jgi:hypothetical protein